MTRYFFRADYHGITATDDVGEEFSNLQEAQVHAALVANELGRNDPQSVVVTIVNKDGMLLPSDED